MLHENVLFYQAFGLHLRATANETADHLRHQLEFTGYLCRFEGTELEAGGGQDRLGQIRRARSDYAARHLLSWLPEAAGAAARAPYPWVRGYLALALALARLAE